MGPRPVLVIRPGEVEPLLTASPKKARDYVLWIRRDIVSYGGPEELRERVRGEKIYLHTGQ